MNRLFAFLDKKLSFRISICIWVLLLLPFIFYLIWESYWFTQVGLRIVKWHTHVVEYMYVWLVGAFLFRIFTGSSFTERVKNIFLLFTSLMLALGITEIVLEITGSTKTYLEKVGGSYDSPYAPTDKHYYHTWSPNKPHLIKKPEYSYWRPTNSLGLPDSEWTTLKQKGEIRIMSLGDSFTEGDGAPYDSSYVYRLNKKLNAAGNTVYMMNAGVCGSDPFSNYVILKDKLLPYHPDMIIQVLATSDMNTDILLRGGMERFQKDGTLKYTSPPWWEPLYAMSYISRIFFQMAGYNELLLQGELKPSEKKWLNEKTADLFKRYAALCRKKGIRLFVVLRPDKDEIETNKYAYNFSYIIEHFRQQNIEMLDLLPAYRQYISKNNSEAKNYFWVMDGHHNAKGYEMMAQTIFDNLKPLLKDSATLVPK